MLLMITDIFFWSREERRQQKKKTNRYINIVRRKEGSRTRSLL